jgi:signal transduction histidine kinase/ActR/RegA family two-component response regulator
MRSLNRRILLYLLVLWGGVAAVGVIGYNRLTIVHESSNQLLRNVYPSAEAALEVETAIHEAYKNTYAYCSILEKAAKPATDQALTRAEIALDKFTRLSRNTRPEQFVELRNLVQEAKTHAIDCLNMTDAGMTPKEFETHVDELNKVQLNVILKLRESAAREQSDMLAGTQRIGQEVASSRTIFVGATLFFLILAVGISYKLSNSVIPPIASLTDAAEQFSAEDLNIRVNDSFPGEFGILARAFNTMADRISDAFSHEEELREQLLQSQKLESLGTLSGGIAHDFNNLLTSMMGFSQLAMLTIDPESKTYENLDRVVKLGGQAAGLTRQLLTFSRQTATEKHPISMVPLAKETIKILERTLPETVQIYSQIHRDVSAIEADATQIQQVLMNLSVNARDAMADGGTLTIKLQNVTLDEDPTHMHAKRSPGDYVCLSVLDTGSGISPDIQTRMFEPFFTTKEVGKGTGLGLSIVHGIVESHGGHIALDSSPETGTEFRLYFPAIQDAVLNIQEAPPATSGTETLLVVEDDDNVREIAEKMLTQEGYTVLTAATGTEGLACYKKNSDQIDLVITDAIMPELGGLELSTHLLAINPDMKILLVSGYNVQEQMESFGPFADFLQKPFDLIVLAAKVREILDKKSQVV